MGGREGAPRGKGWVEHLPWGGGAGEGWVGGAERKHVPLERIIVSFFKKASEVTVASNN